MTPAADRVFDAHIHVMPWHLAKDHIVKTLERTQPQHETYQRILKDPQRLVEFLDQEGITRASLINYVAPEVMGFPPSVNDWVAEYVKDHRDRLFPVGGLHPLHTKNPRGDVERLVHKLELSAIKLHPVHALFHANDYEAGGGALRILYETCERQQVPVMVHTGTSIFPQARNKYGDPMQMDDVAVDYPKLPIILAHAGRPLWMETAMFLARRHPNVHFDISGIPPKKLLEYIPRLEDLADKAIFGSDWPGPMIPSIGQNARDVAALALPQEAKRKILWDNAARLFR